ncbi:MAG: hypothetical protein AB1567_03100 [bacterium]
MKWKVFILVLSLVFVKSAFANQPPYKPVCPDPSNGATNVPTSTTEISLDTETTPTSLTWGLIFSQLDPDEDEVYQELYFGTTTTSLTLVATKTDTYDSVTYTPDKLEHDTWYYWQVVLTDVHGSSTVGDVWSFKIVDNKSPGTPTNLIATPVRSIQIDLSWLDSYDDELDFTIKRKTGIDGIYGTIAVVSTNVGTGTIFYSDKGLSQLTTYYYRVCVRDGYGYSDYSEEVGTTTPINHPPNISNPIPTNGTTNQSATKTILTWVGGDEDGDPVNYHLYFDTISSPGYKANVGTDTTNYYLGEPDLDYDTLYYWQIKAIDEPGSITIGPVWEFKTVDDTPPEIPTGLTATTIGLYQIDLSWIDSYEDELEFIIQRKTGINGIYGTIATVSENKGTGTIFYSDKGLMQNTTYYYRICVRDGCGYSNYSKEASSKEASATTKINHPPNQPGNLTPGNGTTNQIINPILQWTGGDKDGNDVNYILYFGTNTPPGTLATTGTNTTNYIPGTLTHDTWYYWKIIAKDEQGSCTEGAIWRFKTIDNKPPETPTNLTATMPRLNQIDLSWNDAYDDELDFTIQRKMGIEGTYGTIATVSANVTSYSDTGVSQLTTYYYRLCVRDGYGYSAYSEEVGTTTLINHPPLLPGTPSPSNQATNQSNTSTTLTWVGGDPDGDEVTYRIYFDTNTPPAYKKDKKDNIYSPGTLKRNTWYFWQIKAIDEVGSITEGDIWSFKTVDDKFPQAPRGFTANAVKCDQIDLSWQDDYDDELEFIIEKKIFWESMEH